MPALVCALLLGAGSSAQAASTYQSKNLFVMGMPGALVEGAATLTSTDDGISYSIYTSGLKQGATTIWIVVFNNPEECAGGPGACGGSDLGNPDVDGTVIAGGAYNVGPQGLANFQGHLAEGVPPAGIQVNVPAGTFDGGLVDPHQAEIHLVVRGHGKPIPGQAVTQFTTFEPGASPGDQQAVIFPPVKGRAAALSQRWLRPLRVQPRSSGRCPWERSASLSALWSWKGRERPAERAWRAKEKGLGGAAARTPGSLPPLPRPLGLRLADRALLAKSMLLRRLFHSVAENQPENYSDNPVQKGLHLFLPGILRLDRHKV